MFLENACLALVLALPADGPPRPSQETSLREQALQAMHDEDFGSAERILAEVRTQPTDGVRDPEIDYWLSYCARRLGRLAESRALLQRLIGSLGDDQAALRVRCWYDLTCTLALLGESQRALDALERAYREGLRNPEYLEWDPDLGSLRKEPRFGAVLGAMRLERRTIGVLVGQESSLDDVSEIVHALEIANRPGQGRLFEVDVLFVAWQPGTEQAWRSSFRRPPNPLERASLPEVLVVTDQVPPAKALDLESRILLGDLVAWSRTVASTNALWRDLGVSSANAVEGGESRHFEFAAELGARERVLLLIERLAGSEVADSTRAALEAEDRADPQDP